MPPPSSGKAKLTRARSSCSARGSGRARRGSRSGRLFRRGVAALPAVKNARGRESDRPLSSWRGWSARGCGLRPKPTGALLIRRVSLDLTGLPPTPAEIQAFRGRSLAERVREGGGSAARFAALRRAHGVPLDGGGALRRHQRLSDGRPARYVALARLGDRRVQPQHAVRPVHHRAARRRPAAERHARAANRHGLQSQPPHQRAKAASSTRSFAWSMWPIARRPRPRSGWG